MITPLVLLAAIAAPLSYAAALPRPFTLTLLLKDGKPDQFIPEGKGDLTFTDADEKAKTFSYKKTDADFIECTARVTGDPKIEELKYHLDTRTFDDVGDADLSVIHIRCPLKPSDVDNVEGLQPPELTSDTDLERRLNVIFQISNYTTKWDDDPELAKHMNVDWTFEKLPDRSMSLERIAYEEAMSNHSATAFRVAEKYLWNPDELNEEEKAFDKWTGEVGRMAFFTPTEGTRDFTWGPELRKEGESSPTVRHCHVNVKSDPHAETVYVNLDKVTEEETKNQPLVTLNKHDAGAGEWPEGADKGGDAGVIEVKCDDILGNVASTADGVTFVPSSTKSPSKRTAKPE